MYGILDAGKRKNERLTINSSLVIVNLSTEEHITTVLENVSLTGVAIRHKEALPINAEYSITIRFSRGKDVTLVAKIVHASKISHAYRIGLQFLNVDKQTTERLKRFLKFA